MGSPDLGLRALARLSGSEYGFGVEGLLEGSWDLAIAGLISLLRELG